VDVLLDPCRVSVRVVEVMCSVSLYNISCTYRRMRGYFEKSVCIVCFLVNLIPYINKYKSFL
jgi:hypothetical protein